MRKLALVFFVATLVACNNSKKEKNETTNNTTNSTSSSDATVASSNSLAPGSSTVSYSVAGATITHTASLLVSKDKDKLQADAPYLCILTSNAAPNNNEYLTLNFLLDTKPGTYPVVGTSLQRGKDPDSEMYGGILGGQPKITEYKVNITECKNLGSNGLGGNKWSISGNCDAVVIKAMGIMLMDKTKNHPEEIKVEKISFSNLTFDDNMDEMLEKAFDKLKKD